MQIETIRGIKTQLKMEKRKTNLQVYIKKKEKKKQKKKLTKILK